MTPEASLMVQVADALAASGIAYLLAGSFSSNYYGIPRWARSRDRDDVRAVIGVQGEKLD